jgi:hypothetical protein
MCVCVFICDDLVIYGIDNLSRTNWLYVDMD